MDSFDKLEELGGLSSTQMELLLNETPGSKVLCEVSLRFYTFQWDTSGVAPPSAKGQRMVLGEETLDSERQSDSRKREGNALSCTQSVETKKDNKVTNND